MEGAPTQQEGISEWDVINILDSRGIEDPETKAVLGRFVEQCQGEADREAADSPESQEASNRANIKVAIKIAVVYSKTTKYKPEGIEALEEAYVAASQDESTMDLAREIVNLINDFDR